MSTPRSSSLLVTLSGLLLASLTACSQAAPNTGRPAVATVQHDRPSYASTTFVVPFDLTPPVWTSVEPHIEQPHFVTWEAPDLPAVRVLAPVTVYPPDGTGPTAPPRDYLDYLLAQTSHGARFADRVASTVGGQPATLVTATTDRSLDGSLGCPAAGTTAPDCLGLQPELALRIAVVTVQGRTLLVWLRLPAHAAAADTRSRTTAFEQMLTTVRFPGRAVAAPAPSPQAAGGAPAVSALDGNYRMTVSWPKTKVHDADARCVGGPESLSAVTVYDLTLDRGSLQLWVRIGGPSAARAPADHSSFRTTSDQLVFHGDGTTATYSYDHRTLRLSDLKGGDCGDRAIWTTAPWIRR
jgi:hypothetical protein